MSSLKQLFKIIDKRIDHEDIDEFLDHLNVSVNRRIKHLEEAERDLTPEQFDDPRDMEAYLHHLNDLASSAYSAKLLGDELSIIALYKKIELHTSKILKKRKPSTKASKLSNFNQLCAEVPFDITKLNGFSGFNELRLINNSIKHEGKVSNELSKKFPQWTEGSELLELDKVFKRLLPEVDMYIADFVERVYAATT